MTTATTNIALISDAARKIAGCSWDDAERQTVLDRLVAVRNQPALGGDNDLTQADREAIDTLIGLARGESYTLYNLQTGDAIRPATDAEVCECAVAQTRDGGAGGFAVDGIACYVA